MSRINGDADEVNTAVEQQQSEINGDALATPICKNPKKQLEAKNYNTMPFDTEDDEGSIDVQVSVIQKKDTTHNNITRESKVSWDDQNLISSSNKLDKRIVTDSIRSSSHISSLSETKLDSIASTKQDVDDDLSINDDNTNQISDGLRLSQSTCNNKDLSLSYDDQQQQQRNDINKFYSKAEADLMRKLDQRDPLRPNAGIGNSILLNGIPLDDVHHDFKVDDDIPESSKQLDPNSVQAGGPWEEPNITTGNTDVDMKPTTMSITSNSVERPSFGSTFITHHQTSSRSRCSSIDESEATFVERKFTLSRQVRRRNTRRMTIEEKLFGLTAALSEMDDNNDRSDNRKSTFERLSRAPDRLTIVANKILNTLDNQKSIVLHHKKNDNIIGEDPSKHFGNDDIESGSCKLMTTERTMDCIDDTDYTTYDEGRNNNEDSRKKQQGRWFQQSGKSLRFLNLHIRYAQKVKSEWELFNQFLKPRKRTLWTYCRFIFFYLWIPAFCIAGLLYHLSDSPMRGKCEDMDQRKYASISWWIIFVCVREVLLLCIAKMMEIFIVGYLALSTKFMLRTLGPIMTLLIVQSKGWPFLAFYWGILNFALVCGNFDFFHHWLYWQDYYGLFNKCNPSGDVVNSPEMIKIVAITTVVGVVVSIKRVCVSILLGRSTFANYSEQLAKVMNKMLHISEVAELAKRIEMQHGHRQIEIRQSSREFSSENLTGLIDTTDFEDSAEENQDTDDIDTTGSDESKNDEVDRVIDPNDLDNFTNALSWSQKNRIAELLGRWEEPGQDLAEADEVSISAILQFRRALARMDTDFPFSGFFGLADTRESCIASAQDVYLRLMLKGRTVNDKLHFNVIAALAIQKRDGELCQEKAKDLIRTFRPQRDGSLSMVDFVRSVDAVYRELRMLHASVASSSKIDQAIETIINTIFYIVTVCAILTIMGLDPLSLFISLSSVIFGLTFMIGRASAKYFEGILFIVVQRPYGIGDRINVSNPEIEGKITGSQGWIVENVSLFTTTIYLQNTNECATISNGALAHSRIINGARSPQAVCTIMMKFGVDTPYKRIERFKSALEKFVKARPREWLALICIEAMSLHPDLGYIEYRIVIQHRESWQNIGPILSSKQTLNQFCLELAKKLDMRYQSPPLPVEMKINKDSSAMPLSQFDLKYDHDTTSGLDETSAKYVRRQQKMDSRFGNSFWSSARTSEGMHSLSAMFDGK